MNVEPYHATFYTYREHNQVHFCAAMGLYNSDRVLVYDTSLTDKTLLDLGVKEGGYWAVAYEVTRRLLENRRAFLGVQDRHG